MHGHWWIDLAISGVLVGLFVWSELVVRYWNE